MRVAQPSFLLLLNVLAAREASTSLYILHDDPLARPGQACALGKKRTLDAIGEAARSVVLALALTEDTSARMRPLHSQLIR